MDDVAISSVHPKKAFIIGALEKEIRLSFAQRIRGTLPEPYQPLISEAKEKDIPDFKYDSDRMFHFRTNSQMFTCQKSCITNLDVTLRLETPYSAQALEILRLLRAKAPDNELQPHFTAIESLAASQNVDDPLIPSTDAFVTAICFLGAKSLSHVLSYIERCKERLLAIGPRSEVAQRQIIASVMEYWSEKPGIGINVVDKLLNYTILTPLSVITWALVDRIGKGQILPSAHIYEMVAATMHKVINRVRQIVLARNQRGLPAEQVRLLDETLAKERADMRILFATVEDALVGVAEGIVDAMAESRDQDGRGEGLLRIWGGRWLRVFRRKMAVEEAWVGEMLLAGPAAGVGADEHEPVEAYANANGVGEAAVPKKLKTDRENGARGEGGVGGANGNTHAADEYLHDEIE